MSITIELTPEQEAKLQIEAEKHCLHPSEYVRMILVNELTAQAEPQKPRQRSIMELHGLGAELWKDIDVEKYINDSRDEWDSRP